MQNWPHLSRILPAMERYRNKRGPAPARCKRGFTLIEILVSGTILVIAMALIAIFFVKASKIRGAVSKENNTQVITGQMMNVVMFGIGQPPDGLMYAKEIKAIDTNSPSLWITFSTNSGNYIRFKIDLDDDGTTYTLYQQTALISGGWPPTSWTTPPKNLDPNDKINIERSGSYFAYYDNTNSLTSNISAISKIEICLAVKDKNLPDSPEFTLKNTVTLKNIFHID